MIILSLVRFELKIHPLSKVISVLLSGSRTHPFPGTQPDSEIIVEAIANEYDVLILSQSCDLVQGKIETVLVCPHWPIDDI